MQRIARGPVRLDEGRVSDAVFVVPKAAIWWSERPREVAGGVRVVWDREDLLLDDSREEKEAPSNEKYEDGDVIVCGDCSWNGMESIEDMDELGEMVEADSLGEVEETYEMCYERIGLKIDVLLGIGREVTS